MSFSALQWLLSFVLDTLIKFIPLALIGTLVSLGMTAWWSWLFPAIVLSLFHFLCLFLGFSLVASFEIVRINPGPATRFWLGLLFANLFFAAGLNTVHALSLRAPVFEISSATVWLVATNLMSVLTIAACSCLRQRFRRSRVSRASVG